MCSNANLPANQMDPFCNVLARILFLFQSSEFAFEFPQRFGLDGGGCLVPDLWSRMSAGEMVIVRCNWPGVYAFVSAMLVISGEDELRFRLISPNPTFTDLFASLRKVQGTHACNAARVRRTISRCRCECSNAVTHLHWRCSQPGRGSRTSTFWHCRLATDQSEQNQMLMSRWAGG